MRRALLLFVFLAPAANAAEKMPRVAIVEVLPADKADQPAATAIRDALAEGLGWYRVDIAQQPAAAWAKGAGRTDELAAGLRSAEQRAAEGSQLFDKYDTKGAEAAYRESVALYEKNFAGLTKPDDLVGANLKLSRLFFAS
jgi:hypothetical protein